MDITNEKILKYPFPCYDCADIGDEAPRCNDFMTCEKWNNWAHEQGYKVLKDGNMIPRIERRGAIT